MAARGGVPGRERVALKRGGAPRRRVSGQSTPMELRCHVVAAHIYRRSRRLAPCSTRRSRSCRCPVMTGTKRSTADSMGVEADMVAPPLFLYRLRIFVCDGWMLYISTSSRPRKSGFILVLI